MIVKKMLRSVKTTLRIYNLSIYIYINYDKCSLRLTFPTEQPLTWRFETEVECVSTNSGRTGAWSDAAIIRASIDFWQWFCMKACHHIAWASGRVWSDR